MTIGFYVDSVPFTKGIVAGDVSLGGSESACLGLARALKARGHDVHIIATKLDEDCEGRDHAGVVWHGAEQFASMNQFIEWDVFVSLRMFALFASSNPVRARLRLLWNQDLLTQPLPLMGAMWGVDGMVYVSDYQRRQYEQRLPELAGVPAFVTKNGFDVSLVPDSPAKDSNRIIHISRPERGLRPLLAMWPDLRKQRPHAELRICRYSSMYDAQGWGKICASYDGAVQAVNEKVGGVTYLGELGKPDLYREIADAAVMWYPGVVDFAETSCIAAIEAQACGTPFVGSWKGALPETAPGAVLLPGDADSRTYQMNSVAAVLELLDGCRDSSFDYRRRQRDGRAHVTGYTYAVLAGEWEAWLSQAFSTRRAGNALGILRQMLHDDDHVAARELGTELLRTACDHMATADDLTPAVHETADAVGFCHKVIAGADQGPTEYAKFANHPLDDIEYEQGMNGRLMRMVPRFAGCRHVLDVACGNGAFAILLAKAYPEIAVTGIDYAEGNIVAARAAAEQLGVADRCTFLNAAFWNLETQRPSEFLALDRGQFDGAFCGEFLEHVGDGTALIDHIETFLAPGAMVGITVPHGPFTELLPRGTPVHRGHVHQFCHDDLDQLFGDKAQCAYEFLAIGRSPRGAELGHWLIQYRTGDAPTGSRALDHRITTCRPLPRLSVGMIVGPQELDLRRCLDSVWAIADEIVIGDTGMDPTTKAVAEEFGARLVSLDPVRDQPEGFAGARNAVLEAATGDWFLWIDADERLVGAPGLRKYLESGPYNGYGIKQQHLMLDVPHYSDEPIRLFRRRPDIRFYGCVHEQPQMGDANGDITPALQLHDVTIAHTGYLHERQRRDKMRNRNLPLLKRDQQVFPQRRLGKLLWLRDFVNLSDYDREQHDGARTPDQYGLLRKAVALFETEFADPADKYHALARPWYERAVKDLGLGFEVELAIAGRRGGMQQTHAKPKRVWVRSATELERLVAHEMHSVRKHMEPDALRVDPEVGLEKTTESEQESVPA